MSTRESEVSPPVVDMGEDYWAINGLGDQHQLDELDQLTWTQRLERRRRLKKTVGVLVLVGSASTVLGVATRHQYEQRNS